MNFEKLWAPESVKNYLKDSVESNRISHAQLFIGKPGWGTLAAALAYAEAVIAENQPNSIKKVQHLVHPDLHFSIPTFKVEKTEALTKNYIQDFRNLILANPFATLNDWYEKLDAGNKQGFLGKDEIDEVMKTLSLKSYEGGYKVLIIWNADKMKQEYANKFLKLLEEPPAKTLFLLITETTENMLDTILSRCQSVNFKPLDKEGLSHYAQEDLGVERELADSLALKSDGDIRELQNFVRHNENRDVFEKEFADWTRNSALLNKPEKIYLLQELIQQAEKIAGWKTEQQKQYLQFCMEIFRSALMQNYTLEKLKKLEIENIPFNNNKFSSYISGANIEDILEELNQTYFYIERNANKKLAFTNLGIKLARHLHKKVK